MAITPGPGYMIDPNNPNGVIPIGSASTVNNPNANLISGSTAPAPYVPPSTYGAVTQNPAPAPVVQTGTATLANGQVATQYSDGTWKSNGTALSGSLLQEAQTKVSAQNAAPTQNIYEANPYWVRPSTTHAGPETTAEYNDRVAKMNPNLPAPGTTSSTGVTNTAKPALGATGYGGISSAMLTAGSQSQTQYTPAPQLSNETSTVGATTLAGLQVGPEHEKAQVLYDSISKDRAELAGEDQFSREQYSAQGVDSKAQRVNDLSAALALKQQAAAQIQLAQQAGEGVTSAIDQRQRQEAIRTNSIEQSSIAADLQVAKGNYATAKMLADDAIEKKFGPLKATIAAKISNYDMLINSPNFTAEEQKQAGALKAQAAAQQTALAKQEQEAGLITDIWLGAAQNGLKDTAILSQIKNAHTSEEALAIAVQSGFYTKQDPSWSAPFMLGGDYVQKNTKTGEIRTAVNVAANQTAPAEGDNPQLYSGLSTQTATAIRARVNAFKTEPMVQNYAVIQDGNNFASGISATSKNPAEHQALIYALAKALDPGSVVREGEYATAQKYAQSWVAAYGKGITQALAGTGFLSESAINNIKSVIASRYAASKVSYDNLSTQYAGGINSLSGRTDGTKFLTNYTTNSTGTGAPPQSSPTSSTNPLDI